MIEEGRALVPFQDAYKIQVRPEEGLTTDQVNQLNRITRAYLKENRLQGSYVNLTQVMPVIRGCITTGLMTAAGRETIEPSDNLNKAFQIGYRERKALIIRAIDEFEVYNEGLSSSELAIPEPLMNASRLELEKAALTAQLPNLRKLVEEIDIRRPVFNKILDFARDQVEKVIPGSNQMQINRNQEAGLVRNLIFGFVVESETNPLLEIEDFLSHSKDYRETLKNNPSILREFCQLVGLDFNQSISYLVDLSNQTREAISSVPSTQSWDIEDINKFFRVLSPVFLVSNPFYRLVDLSENPKDIGRSIWDANRSYPITLNGLEYRIPKPQVLRLVAYRIQEENPRRSNQLIHAAEAVENLMLELERQSHDNSITQLAEIANTKKMEFITLQSHLQSGRVIKNITLSGGQIEGYAERQLSIMADEQSAFFYLKEFLAEQQNLTLMLLKKYSDGQIPDSEDKSKIFAVRYNSVEFFSRVRQIYRNRIRGRLRTFERMYSNTDFSQWLEWERGTDTLKPYFAKAISTTVIDVLSTRTDSWMRDYISQPNDLSGKLKTIWKAALALELQEINTALRIRAHDYLKLRGAFSLGSIGWNDAYNRLITGERSTLLYDTSDWLRIKINQYERWRTRMATGNTPAFNELPTSYNDSWLKSREEAFNDSIKEWNYKSELSVPIETPSPSAFKRFSETKQMIRDGSDLQDFFESLSHPFAATRVLIQALSRIPPQELWNQASVSLRHLIHETTFRNRDIIWEPNRKRPEIVARNKKISSLYRQYFSDQGINLSDETYSTLVSTEEINAIYGHGNSLVFLWGVEDEFINWESSLEERLRKQLELPNRLLESLPKKALDYYRSRYTKSRNELVNTIRDRRQGAEEWVTRLQNFGVILPESSLIP